MPRFRGAKEAVQDFVGSLKDFNSQLSPVQQTMLGRTLDAASLDGTAGYGQRMQRSGLDPSAEQDETAGYGKRIPYSETVSAAEQDETAGYGRKIPHRSETPSQDDEGRWEQLTKWLSSSQNGEDETEGFGRQRP